MYRSPTPVPLVPPTVDRRATTRVPAELEVDCESSALQLFALTRDLSPCGAFVATLAPMEPGSEVDLRLTGPALDGFPTPPLTVAGVVAWARPYAPSAPGAGPPGVGVRFVDVDDRTLHALTQLVRRLARSQA